MFRLVLLFVVTAVCSHAQSAADVSVRLRPLKGTVSVTGTDLVVIDESRDDKEEAAIPVVRGKRGFDRLSFSYRQAAGREEWTVADSVTSQVIAKIQGRKIGLRGRDLRVDLRPAPSHVQLVAGRKGAALNLVGFLSVEDYLEGVVPSEVPRGWPVEALKAQAVAARSFTIAKIREREKLSPDWLLESGVSDQVFDFSRNHSETTDAVRATAGEVLMAGDARVVSVNYHSDCGGRTDEPQTIWGGATRTGTAVDSACASATRSAWRYQTTYEALSKRLAARGLLPIGFELSGLSVATRSDGGRALMVKALGPGGLSRSFSGERFREALGYNDFKSTLFEINSTANGVEFTGRGFGHGAGLCQWGSRQMAANGKTYREILLHYYPRLRLQKNPRSRGDDLRLAGVTPGPIASP